MSPSNRYELATRIADRQRSLTAAALETAGTALPVLQMVRDAGRRTDALMAKSAERYERDCAAGCSACCYLQVAITIPEAIRIVDGLAKTRSAAEFNRLRDAFRARADLLRGTTLEDRARLDVPCLLLGDDGACSIYAFRPLGCRAYTSKSRARCEAARAARIPGDDGAMDGFAWSAAAAVIEGLTSGMQDAAVDPTHYEFHSLISLLLDDSALADAWLGGEDVVGDCLQVKSERLLGPR